MSEMVVLTISICSSKFGFEISTTCNKRSDSLTSSNVDLNDSTS